MTKKTSQDSVLGLSHTHTNVGESEPQHFQMNSHFRSWNPMALKKFGATLGYQIEPSLDIEKVLKNTYPMWGHISPFEDKKYKLWLKVELAPTIEMSNGFHMECRMCCWKGFSKGYNFGT